LVDEFDVGTAVVGARILSGAECCGAVSEHLSDTFNDCFTNETYVFVEERQPFLRALIGLSGCIDRKIPVYAYDNSKTNRSLVAAVGSLFSN